ncbi:MAG: winged helix DNA-binding domain-containing protein [Solirubrobacteraceae bacterium]
MIAQRFRAQLLAGLPAGEPIGVVKRLLAVQGQDPRGARLAIRARSTGLSAADVDRALSDGSLLISWLNRGTLHLIRSEDYRWLHALTTPPLFTGNARRLGQEGVSPDAAQRGVKVIERALAAEGPLTRGQLRERIAAAGVPTAGQALAHILILASLRGLVVRGPMLGPEHAYVLVRDWLGKADAEVGLADPVERDRALAELARRYLAGHGPASDRDLARWAGLPLRDARAGLASITAQLVPRDDGLLDLAGRPPSLELPPPRLLGAFDPVLLGWSSREEIVGSEQLVPVTSNGVFRAFALVGGRAAALWRLAAGEVVIEPFGRLSDQDAAALDSDAQDVLRFLTAA